MLSPDWTSPNGSVALYKRDCCEVLPQLPARSVHLAFVDPPFNLGKDYEDEMAPEAYVAWIGHCLSHICSRVTFNGSIYVMTRQERVGDMMAILGTYAAFRNLIVWFNSSMPARTRYCLGYQPILYYVMDPHSYIFNHGVQRRVSKAALPWGRTNKGCSIKDIWDDIPFVSGGCMASKEAVLAPGTKRKAHPAQMPMALATRAILHSSNPGDTVLDPMMGSGTAMEAAIRVGRKAIGIEIRQDYFALACERVTRTLLDLQNGPQPPRPS